MKRVDGRLATCSCCRDLGSRALDAVCKGLRARQGMGGVVQGWREPRYDSWKTGHVEVW